MFDPKTASAEEVAKFIKEDSELAHAIAAAKPPEVPRHLDGTPKSPEHRVDWERVNTDGEYFDRIRASGEWQAGLAARAEREKAEREAERKITNEKELAALLESNTERDRALQAAEDAREARRAQGVFGPLAKG
jgi:hypothetical protein